MDELFPLPVTPFEYYYLCDDRPDYPTTFLIELTFTGQLERDPLAGALALVLSRHPLLAARIDRLRGGRPNWIAGEGPPLDWATDTIPILPERLDLTETTGLRVWVRTGAATTRVVLQIHHACCDGLAGLRFVEELLLAYHALFDPSGPPLPPLDPLRLRHRDQLEAERQTSLREVWRTLKFWAGQLARSPAALASSTPNLTSASRPLFHTAVLDADQARLLRRAATAQGATLNDLLIRDLLLVLAQWNAERQTRSPWLRINVPTSLREQVDKLLPATNVLGFSFVTQKVRPDSDPDALLAAVCRETEAIKRDRAGRYFLGGLALACGIPGLIPWALRRKRSFATIVLSNVGKVYARTPLPRKAGQLICGQALLQRVTGVPPIRPLTRAAIVVTNYADEMTLSMQVDPRTFRPPDAEEFLRAYFARLQRSIEPQAARVPATATTAPIAVEE